MGIWDFVYQNTPDIKQTGRTAIDYTSAAAKATYNYGSTAAVNTCAAAKTTLNYGSAAADKIDQVVRVDGLQKLISAANRPGNEIPAQIGFLATRLGANAAEYAIHEGFKSIPGGKVVHKVVKKTLEDVRKENLIDQKEARNNKAQSGSPSEQQRIEDVISDFMKTEFVGNRLFVDTMVGRRPSQPGEAA